MPDSFTNDAGRLLLMQQAENENVWGDRHNSGVTQLLADALFRRVNLTILTGQDVTLTTANGATDQARCAFVRLTGNPGETRNVIVPGLDKLYLVQNATSDDSDVVVKTASDTGVTVAGGALRFLYVSGVGPAVFDVSDGGVPDLATNALQLGGVVAANYARRDAFNLFTRPSSAQATVIASGASPTPDLSSGTNFFTFAPAVNYTIQLPSNAPNNGSGTTYPTTFAVEINHAANVSGAFASGYVWKDGQPPSIAQSSTFSGYFQAQYLPLADAWLGALIEDIA